MGTIILHAGMAKAGSSSIQHWLAGRAEALASERDVHVIRVVPGDTDDEVELVASNAVHSRSLLFGVQRLARDRRKEPSALRTEARGVFERLDVLARSRATIVLTNEAYQLAFWNRDEAFLCELDELARAHRVRVAYYVRPQHTAMEAAWRQWGFRLPIRPSEYLRRSIPEFDYLQTLEQVREVAPHVSFEMRPFRDDLLVGGDVVVDFATTFLGAEELAFAIGDEQRSNRGFPLDLVVELRHGKGRFWASHHDNDRLDQLRELVTRWDVPDSGQVRRSRQVLQEFCHGRFEPGNQRLIGTLDWDTDVFVPPLARSTVADAADHGLSVLDELWSSPSTAAERELLFGALSELVSSSSSRAMETSAHVGGTEDAST